VTVFAADGRTARFDAVANDGWRDAATGCFYAGREPLNSALIGLGAEPLGRPDNAFHMSDAQMRYWDTPMFRELHVLPARYSPSPSSKPDLATTASPAPKATATPTMPAAPATTTATPTPQATPNAASKAIAIVLAGEKLTINGQPVPPFLLQDDLVKLFGAPSRSNDVQQRMLTWDDLGLSAAVDPTTGQVVALRVVTGQDAFAYAAKRPFGGTLNFDGAAVTASTAVEELNRTKKEKPFVPMPDSLWRIELTGKKIMLKSMNDAKAIVYVEFQFQAF
jgi:hypothetical protein